MTQTKLDIARSRHMIIEWEDVSLVKLQTTAVLCDGKRLLIQIREHPFLDNAWGFSINGLGPVTYYGERDAAVTHAESYIKSMNDYAQKVKDEEA